MAVHRGFPACARMSRATAIVVSWPLAAVGCAGLMIAGCCKGCPAGMLGHGCVIQWYCLHLREGPSSGPVMFEVCGPAAIQSPWGVLIFF